ncbi:hypothetical protein DFR68_102146 [Nocardia mexicana]|uniref:Uncharacterized protein n=1 Tax=Nocardia mexicana TaxID=279262 RepID=A0A370HCC7_9NOCA|nr:hypothetical protein DFR68_102146 [Nocardia mexicana]
MVDGTSEAVQARQNREADSRMRRKVIQHALEGGPLMRAGGGCAELDEFPHNRQPMFGSYPLASLTLLGDGC